MARKADKSKFGTRESEIMNIMTALFDQDYVTRMYGIDQKREGKIEGMNEGKIEGKKETALKLLQMGMTIEVISEATGLSKEEIEKLGKQRDV